MLFLSLGCSAAKPMKSPFERTDIFSDKIETNRKYCDSSNESCRI